MRTRRSEFATPGGNLSSRLKMVWAGKPSAISDSLHRKCDVRYASVSSTPESYESDWAARPDLSTQIEQFEIQGFIPDLVLLWHPNFSTIYGGIEKIRTLSVACLGDSPFLFPWQSELAGLFDAVLPDSPQTFGYFRRNTPAQLRWLPLCYLGDGGALRGYNPQKPRVYDVAFVGNLNPDLMPHRVRFFDALKARLESRCRTHIGNGSVTDIYPRSKIVINFSTRPRWSYLPSTAPGPNHAHDLNYRFFEAMGCGAMLLTDTPAPEIDQLFEPGRHFDVYRHGEVDTAIERIEYHLTHPEKRLAIAQAGWEEVIRSHTASARAHQLCGILEDVMARGPMCHRSPSERELLLARALLRLALHVDYPPESWHPLLQIHLESARSLFSRAGRDPSLRTAVSFLGPLFSLMRGETEEASRAWLAFTDRPEWTRLALASLKFLCIELRELRLLQSIMEMLARLGDVYPPGWDPLDEVLMHPLIFKSLNLGRQMRGRLGLIPTLGSTETIHSGLPVDGPAAGPIG